MELVNPRGQTRHSAMYRDERRDPSCDGVVRAAYIRKVVEGKQRWVRVGEHCEGCGSFWPGAKRESYRSIERRESAERRVVMEMRRAQWGPDPRRHRSYKAGRNDPCPCGSGLKFKRCHGAGGQSAAPGPPPGGGAGTARPDDAPADGYDELLHRFFEQLG